MVAARITGVPNPMAILYLDNKGEVQTVQTFTGSDVRGLRDVAFSINDDCVYLATHNNPVNQWTPAIIKIDLASRSILWEYYYTFTLHSLTDLLLIGHFG